MNKKSSVSIYDDFDTIMSRLQRFDNEGHQEKPVGPAATCPDFSAVTRSDEILLMSASEIAGREKGMASGTVFALKLRLICFWSV